MEFLDGWNIQLHWPCVRTFQQLVKWPGTMALKAEYFTISISNMDDILLFVPFNIPATIASIN